MVSSFCLMKSAAKVRTVNVDVTYSRSRHVYFSSPCRLGPFMWYKCLIQWLNPPWPALGYQKLSTMICHSCLISKELLRVTLSHLACCKFVHPCSTLVLRSAESVFLFDTFSARLSSFYDFRLFGEILRLVSSTISLEHFWLPPDAFHFQLLACHCLLTIERLMSDSQFDPIIPTLTSCYLLVQKRRGQIPLFYREQNGAELVTWLLFSGQAALFASPRLLLRLESGCRGGWWGWSRWSEQSMKLLSH